MKTLFFLLLIPIGSGSAFATNYYVSASVGSTSNDGKSDTKPFLTIQKAADLTVAGDTVFVMNGTYNSTSGPVLTITRSGTANGYITYKALKGHTPKLMASGNVWNALSINGSYVVFDGFELQGNNANITYDEAYKAYTDFINGVAGPNANFNTNGISIGGPGTESKLPSHVTIRNCRVHDFPGGGISAIQSDYTTIENNVVYNNAWYMMYGGSGISILTPVNTDSVTTYKNIVRNNICHTNKTTIPWASQKRLSDGNGIIIDINQHPYSSTTGPAYTGRTLVTNNVSSNNGGSGIHAYLANHVDIIDNTAYNNGTVVGYADIFSNGSMDVNIINNIMYARTGGSCNSNNKNVNVVYDYNVYFNGTVAVQGPHDLVADPQFVNPSTDLTVGNFTLKSTSPAIDRGSSVVGQFNRTDLLGTSRPQGAAPDMGAYEFQTKPVITSLIEPLLREAITVFPNPTENLVTIRWVAEPKAKGRVDIVNCLGELMMQASLSANLTPISTQKLASGLYLLLIYRDDKLINASKLIKQ